MSRIFTIGYEGAELSAFIDTLVSAGVERVVDVRAVLNSRRRGFSKTALGNALAESGLDYICLRALGDPKPGRDAARAGRHREFEAIYTKHLATPEAQAALVSAGDLAVERPSCLLCYEYDPTGCHRNIVARHLAKQHELAVTHLFVSSNIAGNGQGRIAQRAGGGGQGSAAACQ